MPPDPPRSSRLTALARDAFGVFHYLSAYFSNSAIYSIFFWKPCVSSSNQRRGFTCRCETWTGRDLTCWSLDLHKSKQTNQLSDACGEEKDKTPTCHSLEMPSNMAGATTSARLREVQFTWSPREYLTELIATLYMQGAIRASYRLEKNWQSYLLLQKTLKVLLSSHQHPHKCQQGVQQD